MSYRDTKDWDALHGLDPAAASVPLEVCPTHGMFEFNLWAGCPSCEDEDAAAWEAEKVRREWFDHRPIPQRKPAA